DEFVKQMNFTAKRLGMTRTHFVNPNGLPAPEQVTTARDLAKLSRAIMREYPQYAPLWSMADMRIGRIKLRTHNRLLKTYEGADGLKTGFTCDSGYNVIATASREGRKLVAIVLGEPSGAQRNLRTANLLEHGFQYAPWDSVLGSKTIDAMPVAPETKSVVTTVRNTVVGFECGRRRARVVAKSQQKRQKAAQVKAQKSAGGGAVSSAAAAPAAPVAPVAPTKSN
ncbi:MAG: D-alanyl-D-alanine carboxypeptidase, partial [Hyphomicrobiaceae bacterium]